MAYATNGLQPHPEWRQLLKVIQPQIETKKSWTYEELNAIAGCDIQSDHGRKQFYIFRRHILKNCRLWLEVVIGLGYEAIPASGHAAAAMKRVRQGRRKIGVAKAIQQYVRIEEMNQQQILQHAQVGALIDDLWRGCNQTVRAIAAVGSAFKLELSPESLQAIADAGPPKVVVTKPSTFGISMSADALRAMSSPKPKPKG